MSNAVSGSVQPRLAHCGIYVSDIQRQVQFYTRVLGLIVSDRGVSKRIGNEFAFLTAATDHHHQIVFISGRQPQTPTTVNQLSFKVANIDELKAMYRRAADAGIDVKRQINHGNALSFYFSDPEGNGIEVYMDTPWYVPQPHGVPIDLTLPAETGSWPKRRSNAATRRASRRATSGRRRSRVDCTAPTDRDLDHFPARLNQTKRQTQAATACATRAVAPAVIPFYIRQSEFRLRQHRSGRARNP